MSAQWHVNGRTYALLDMGAQRSSIEEARVATEVAVRAAKDKAEDGGVVSAQYNQGGFIEGGLSLAFIHPDETKYCVEEHRQYAVVDWEVLGPLISIASPQAASKGSALSERVAGRPNRHSASEGDE